MNRLIFKWYLVMHVDCCSIEMTIDIVKRTQFYLAHRLELGLFSIQDTEEKRCPISHSQIMPCSGTFASHISFHLNTHMRVYIDTMIIQSIDRAHKVSPPLGTDIQERCSKYAPKHQAMAKRVTRQTTWGQ